MRHAAVWNVNLAEQSTDKFTGLLRLSYAAARQWFYRRRCYMSCTHPKRGTSRKQALLVLPITIVNFVA